MAVSLGARAALVDALGDRGRVGLKWPNDILVGDDKIGGVLAEASWPPAGPGEVVVGVGINVSQSAEELPPRATSFVTLGADVPERTELAAAVIRETEGYYRRLVQGESLVSVWAEALVTIGRPVTALTADGRVEGRAIDVADDGALRVLTTGGRLVTLHEGDVSLGHRMEGERENDCA